MPAITASYYTDPTCPWSWALEPSRRHLQEEFGAAIELRYVMGGLAREFGTAELPARIGEWLDAGDRSGMPVDPRLWLGAPPASSYPACLAALAAAEQGPAVGEAYLRRLREGLLCGRRKLDTTAALAAEAQAVAGLDVARFRVDLGSNAIVERFGADLDRATAAGSNGARVALPTVVFEGPGGSHAVAGLVPWAAWREAAVAAGATPRGGEGRPTPEEALRRLGALATAEVAAVCDLPGPRAAAELWRLAAEWRVRPQRHLTGELWIAA